MYESAVKYGLDWDAVVRHHTSSIMNVSHCAVAKPIELLGVTSGCFTNLASQIVSYDVSSCLTVLIDAWSGVEHSANDLYRCEMLHWLCMTDRHRLDAIHAADMLLMELAMNRKWSLFNMVFTDILPSDTLNIVEHSRANNQVWCSRIFHCHK